MFVYDGWINVGVILGEMKFLEKDLLRVIVGGLLLVMVVYIIINIVYFWVVLVSELVIVIFLVILVVIRLFGNIGGKVIIVGILILVFGILNGYLLIGLRIFYILVEMGILLVFKIFLKVNFGGFFVNLILFIIVLVCVYVLFG